VLSLSPIKLIVIIAVILVVLGPDKLPEVSHQIGSAWRSLKEWQTKIEKEVRDVVPDLPSTADIARIARSPVNLLNSLADRVMTPEESVPTVTREHPDPPPETSNEEDNDAESPVHEPTIMSRDTPPPTHHYQSVDPSLN
jgi:TatA/E family protein of Tat protein translocase